MLCLSRHKDESIVINGNIIVTVIEIRGHKVRLGITAPVDIPVNRQEIEDLILKKQAAPAAESKDAGNCSLGSSAR